MKGVFVLAAASTAEHAHAQDAGAPTCTEYVPAGASRPRMTETFPDEAKSGYAATLVVEIEHGLGETVLPGGLKIARGTPAAEALAGAGFTLPEPDGGASPSLVTEKGDDAAKTRLELPIVVLPKDAAAGDLELPPLPVAVARASGEVMTLCTKPHPIRALDPTAEEADPKVRPNPPPRPQREPWLAAKIAALAALLALLFAGLGALAYRKWGKRPKLAPAEPPKLPWVLALEELEAVRRSSLLEEGKRAEFVGRVSDTLRKYLGGRYGFDGLESTTDEIRAYLKRIRPPVAELPRIGELLSACDLVKFARVDPAEEDCKGTLESAETIVRATTPAPSPEAPGGPRPSASQGAREERAPKGKKAPQRARQARPGGAP